MKTFIATMLIILPTLAESQGLFLFSNFTAPTRLGSSNGPLAGRGIWAQMLVGQSTDSLTPVDMPVEHIGNGIASGRVVAVPEIPPNTFAYIQMVAWDGIRWGTSLNGVPSDQLGRTDIVQRSAAQWLKLSTDANGNFISITNGRAYDASSTDPHYYYFPSLMVNKVGDMVMGFSGSRSNEFIGAFYSYRVAGGAITNGPLVLKAGQGAYAFSSRWGDYSYTSLDPTDSLSFWTVQDYAEQDPSNEKWGTWISEIAPNAPNP